MACRPAPAPGSWGIAVGPSRLGRKYSLAGAGCPAGTLGFLVTTPDAAVMYGTSSSASPELTASIPHAGGPFAQKHTPRPHLGGYPGGYGHPHRVRLAPPAIALAIGASTLPCSPAPDPKLAAVGPSCSWVFNIIGSPSPPPSELFVTLLAIPELLVFMGGWRRASPRTTSPWWPSGADSFAGRHSASRGQPRHLVLLLSKASLRAAE